MSSDLNLNVIRFQSQLRSKPIRENFSDIENNFNSLRAEVSASIASTASEITSARDNHGNLSDNIHMRKVYDDAIFNGTVGETSTASMKVHVTTGTGIVNGVGVDWLSATSGTVTAPTTNPRIDLVVANTDNSVSIVTGTEAASPAVPDISSTQYPIAKLALNNTTGTVTTSHITNYKRRIPKSEIGEIFAVHPDITSTMVPNEYHSVPCDGVELLDTNNFSTSNETTVPDLTDERFLQGFTTYATAGANTHVHQWYKYGIPLGTDQSYDSDGSATNLTTTDQQGTKISADFSDSPMHDKLNKDFYTDVQDSRPNYFSVKYYMRIR